MRIKIKSKLNVDRGVMQRVLRQSLEEYIEKEVTCEKCGSRNLKPEIYRIDNDIEGYAICIKCNSKVKIIGKEEVQKEIQKIFD